MNGQINSLSPRAFQILVSCLKERNRQGYGVTNWSLQSSELDWKTIHTAVSPTTGVPQITLLKSDQSSSHRSSTRSDIPYQMHCSGEILPTSYDCAETMDGRVSDLFKEEALDDDFEVLTPSSTDGNISILEPQPIDEGNLTIFDGKDTKFLEAQQQQMENLLETVLLPDSSVSSGSAAVDASTKNPTSPKRGLVEGFFQPAKRRCHIKPTLTQLNPNAPPIVEDAMTKTSGRFRLSQCSLWSARFQELQGFYRRKGHCCVPHNCPEYPALARWVKRQRYQYKLHSSDRASTMTSERITALEDIGFIFDSRGVAWMERFNEFQEYLLKFKSSNVSSNYSNCHGKQLSSWMKCQKRQYKMFKEGKPSRLTLERVAKLESLGGIKDEWSRP